MGNLLAADNNAGGTGKIRKYSGFSSTILNSFTTTDTIGVTWDNTNIMYGQNGASNKVRKGTGFAGSPILDSFTAAGTPYALDWDGTNLHLARSNAFIYMMTGFSATVNQSYTIASNTFRGVAYDGTNSFNANTVAKVRKQSGFGATVSDSFTVTNLDRDISWDGTNILSTNNTNSKYRQHSGFSSTITSSFTAAGVGEWDGIDDDAFPVATAAAKAKRHLLLGMGT